MAIAAHTPGGYGGVPQSVGKEFHNADRSKYGHKPEHRSGHLRLSGHKSAHHIGKRK